MLDAETVTNGPIAKCSQCVCNDTLPSAIALALPFGRLWYAEPNATANAIGYAKHRSRSHDAVIRVYAAGNVIETH